LATTVSHFDERLVNIKIISQSVNTKPYEEIIKKDIPDMQLMVNNQPKITIPRTGCKTVLQNSFWQMVSVVGSHAIYHQPLQMECSL
jgi:hypothetical protein